MITIIYVHPWDGSFNKAILDRIVENLESKKTEKYQIIDLYKENFNPVMSKEELSLYNKGESLDPAVKKYQKILKETDKIIFIFPIWWFEMPAMLKGFIDKVMLKGFSYEETSAGLLKGKLGNIKNVSVVTTSGGPKWYFKLLGGNYIEKVFMKNTLKNLGMKKSKWINFGNIKKSSSKQREIFLNNLKEKV